MMLKTFLLILILAPTVLADTIPNVIVTGDRGYPDLGAYGLSDDIRTPHLDKLAAKIIAPIGKAFSDALLNKKHIE